MIKSTIIRIMTNLRVHKRITIILFVILLVFSLIVGSLLLSNRIWSSYVTGYNQKFNNAKTDIESVILHPSANTDNIAKVKINSLKNVQKRLSTEIKSYCNVNWLIRWQNYVGMYSDNVKKCNQKKDRLNQLLADLGNVTSLLRSERELSAIIFLANNQTNQLNKPKNWDKIESIWRKSVVDTSKLSVSDQFMPVKSLSITKLTNIAEAWKQISRANKAKNRQQYEKASSDLDKAYVLLSKVSDICSIQIKKTTSNLYNSYKTAF